MKMSKKKAYQKMLEIKSEISKGASIFVRLPDDSETVELKEKVRERLGMLHKAFNDIACEYFPVVEYDWDYEPIDYEANGPDAPSEEYLVCNAGTEPVVAKAVFDEDWGGTYITGYELDGQFFSRWADREDMRLYIAALVVQQLEK